MQLHEREKVVREAKLALSEKILEWMEEHSDKLTFAEELRAPKKLHLRFWLGAEGAGGR